MLPLPTDFICCHSTGSLQFSLRLPCHISCFKLSCVATLWACVSTPVGSTTSFGSMFGAKLISLIGIYSLLGCKHYPFSLLVGDGSWFCHSQKSCTLQAHSWNRCTVQHSLVRTDHIAVAHNRIVIFPSPSTLHGASSILELRRFNDICKEIYCSVSFIRHQVSLLLSSKTMDTKSPTTWPGDGRDMLCYELTPPSD